MLLGSMLVLLLIGSVLHADAGGQRDVSIHEISADDDLFMRRSPSIEPIVPDRALRRALAKELSYVWYVLQKASCKAYALDIDVDDEYPEFAAGQYEPLLVRGLLALRTMRVPDPGQHALGKFMDEMYGFSDEDE